MVDDLWINASTSTTTDEFKYALDLVSNVTAMTNVVDSSFNQSFTYDNLDQLLTFTQGTHTQSFNYDVVDAPTVSPSFPGPQARKSPLCRIRTQR